MPTTIEYVCPFCAEEIPTRNYLRHILHNHRLALANSMTGSEKTEIKRLKVPIVLGKREGKRILATCLECETGHTTASRDKEAMNFTLEQIAEKHAKCGKSFDKWASYYIATAQVDVPNEVRKAGTSAPIAPVAEAPVWPVWQSQTTNPVPTPSAGVPVAPAGGAGDSGLLEENTALKAALAEAERKIAEMRRVIQSYGILM